MDKTEKKIYKFLNDAEALEGRVDDLLDVSERLNTDINWKSPTQAVGRKTGRLLTAFHDYLSAIETTKTRLLQALRAADNLIDTYEAGE